MKKGIQMFCTVLLWILIATTGTEASEKLLFVDYTQDEHILSLKDFFTQEANLLVILPPEPLPSQEEITTPAYLEKLALLGNLLFV
ncbi:MAG: hypothetical protein HPY68_09405, partial [Candidatus Atribacteria bacterium]|nr:hypothetical protein [Candidatus Atribacteria bacterium]